MDGFRDRLGRGASDRGMREDRFDRSDRLDRSDRFDESRFDRGSRRSSYGSSQQMGSMSEPSVTADEIARIIDDSNANQLNIITDINEETKDFIYSANQKVQNSIDMILRSVDGTSSDNDKLDAIKKTLDSVAECVSNPVSSQVTNDQDNNEAQDEILRTVRDNSDLLTQFAEEQIPMLIRGNSSMLSQISESLEEKGELIRELLMKSNSESQQINPVMPLPDSGANEEVLQTVVNNNTLLNALRAEVAGLQSEMRDSAVRSQADDNGPLDATPVTKEEIDLLYRDMEDHVHKECVKVYKNVQAALEAQNASVSDSVKKGTGGLKFLIIFNLILTVVNILLAVAGALNILA